MDERKVTIGNVTERDAIGMLECVAEVPQDRDVRVLPDDDRARRDRQHCRSRPLDGRGEELVFKAGSRVDRRC